METKVVNKYHKVPYDIYIGRGSKWGNPFSHMDNTKAQFKVETREEAIEKYREWILTQPQLLEDLHELTLFLLTKVRNNDILLVYKEVLIRLIKRKIIENNS